MGWRGIAFGGLVGGLSGGALGAVFGAVLGHRIEDRIRRMLKQRAGARADFSMPGYDPLADSYRTLGVGPDASDDEIRSAYRKLAKKHHPDVIKSSGLSDAELADATERMKRINSAWKVLKNARGL
jgi:DnaJ like chaperone protein